ncbi:hypothetical protein AP064_05490 [Candidatus Liberibacter solanacearum]|uniref:hypothetical protein n=1 Tax=Candidatus Liberibacter solanacearum TaxID=556287 RepID=UPI0005FA0FE4|nr:hypothetical protein [Candidatus Liberibacter solanacearum]KQC48688.1 hypothetical protein AP064_05490 [Candidatus Liberibacter solanacearum]
MNKVDLYHEKLKKSFYYSDTQRARRSHLDEEFIKESINFIEVILKRYKIEPLSFKIELKDVEKYLGSISIIRDYIITAEFKEAKLVRIRWNENRMPSQTGK